MSATVILAGIVFLLIILASVSHPFFEERKRNAKPTEPSRSAIELEDQLMQWVNAVRDLDFDFDTGKIAEQDYVTTRKLLIGRGVSTLIRLDEAQRKMRELDQEIEQLIAAYRQNG